MISMILPWKIPACGADKLIYQLINCLLFLVFVAAHRLPLVEASGRYSSLRCVRFSLQWLLLLWGTGSRGTGLGSCGTQA